MKPRIIYIHGNQTTHWSAAFAGALKDRLDSAGFPTFFETMPDSIIARSEYWLPFLRDHIKAGENDVLVGWSSGAVAAMRYAETHKILGSVLISPCYTDLNDEMEKQSGYYDAPWQWEAIRSNQKHTALVWGNDDPYIPQDDFEYIATQLKPARIKVSRGGHFINHTELPEVYDYLVATYS